MAFEQGQPSLLAYLCRRTNDQPVHRHPAHHPRPCSSLRQDECCRLDKHIEAAAIAGLVDANAATLQKLRERGLAQLLAELRATLPTSELARCMAEGARLDPESTARTWLARLEAEAS